MWVCSGLREDATPVLARASSGEFGDERNARLRNRIFFDDAALGIRPPRFLKFPRIMFGCAGDGVVVEKRIAFFLAIKSHRIKVRRIIVIKIVIRQFSFITF